MRAFCVLLALMICAVFLYGWTDHWPKAVQAYHDLSGVLLSAMVLTIVAAPLVILTKHSGGGSEWGAAGDAEGDEACN